MLRLIKSNKSINITYKGKTQNLKQWSRILGLNYQMTRYFYHNGLTLEEVINRPNLI